MKVKVLREAGYEEAMLGLSLSYEQPVENMPAVAEKLLKKGGSHVKFLESIAVWLDIVAPRFFWQQEATYRCGISRQSGSTMHTILRRPLTDSDFEDPISLTTLHRLNRLVAAGEFTKVKNELPEGFLQRRIVSLNYKVLRHIYGQRCYHKLGQWHHFIDSVLEQVQFPEFVTRSGDCGCLTP